MNKRIPTVFGLILMIIAIWLLVTPNNSVHQLRDRLDNLGYDLQLRAHVLTQNKGTFSPVAIIDIDDNSLKAIGRWPWPRNKLADLSNALHEQGAGLILFDIFFPEQEANIAETVLNQITLKVGQNPSLTDILTKNKNLFDQDALLATSIASTPSILSISLLPTPTATNQLPAPMLTITPEDAEQIDLDTAQGYISNILPLQEASKGSGFNNIFPDSDGIIRRTPLVMEYKDGVYPALALQAALTYLNEKGELVTQEYHNAKKLEGIKIGARVIPTDDKGRVLIPFIGKSFTFPYYSAIDILNKKVPKENIQDKILIIGTSATGSGDLHSTAIDSPYPGVEIQASLVNGILENHFSQIPAWATGFTILLICLFGLIGAFLFPHFGPKTLSAIIIIVPPVLIEMNTWFWEQSGLILSIQIPLILILAIALLNLIYGYLFESRRREHLKEMFGQYVPKKHIDEMLKTSSDYGLHGEDREMSVLFADIRGFTTISEGLTATELVAMLNTLFNPITEVIFNNRGTIDKYVGDLVMAFWGAPLRDKNHARNAILSALQMQTKIKDLNKKMAGEKWHEVHMGMGINSGIMSVGDMGSRYRRNYTVLGDSVNLASRVESLSKYYGAHIVVTEATQNHQPQFVFRKLDCVRVKGKTQGVNIYEVLCEQKHASPEMLKDLERYHEGLTLYFHQKWDDAYAIMNELHQQHPHAKIYSLYMERINEMKAQTLPPDWDGIYTHTSK